jgi:hypothetical protein
LAESVREALLFLKKEAKNVSRVLRTLNILVPHAFQRWNACGAGHRSNSNGQKFFGSFLQKRTAFFP